MVADDADGQPLLEVAYRPLDDTVARLDPDLRVLWLDTDSPPEDHCWALAQALGLMMIGSRARTDATAARRLRLCPQPRRPIP